MDEKRKSESNQPENIDGWLDRVQKSLAGTRDKLRKFRDQSSAIITPAKPAEEHSHPIHQSTFQKAHSKSKYSLLFVDSLKGDYSVYQIVAEALDSKLHIVETREKGLELMAHTGIDFALISSSIGAEAVNYMLNSIAEKKYEFPVVVKIYLGSAGITKEYLAKGALDVVTQTEVKTPEGLLSKLRLYLSTTYSPDRLHGQGEKPSNYETHSSQQSVSDRLAKVREEAGKVKAVAVNSAE
jgi:hypothetical protein